MPESAQFEQPADRVATYEKLREKLASLTARRIVVNIRSAGGDVNDALLMHDALASHGARITTRCYGYVASAATIIAQAASPARREISANALYLIHNSVSHAEGNAQSMGSTIELLAKTDERIAAVYAQRSGLPAETFAVLMSENSGNGRWLSPAETLEKGLADKIIEAAPITNDARRQLADLGLPGIPSPTAEPQTRLAAGLRKLLGATAPIAEELSVDEQVNESTPVNQSVSVAADASTQTPKTLKQAAKPTSVEMVEDSFDNTNGANANQEAYRQDALNFR